MNQLHTDISKINLAREEEDKIFNIIKECGAISLKEKVTLLYMTIDYIFMHNPAMKKDNQVLFTIH